MNPKARYTLAASASAWLYIFQCSYFAEQQIGDGWSRCSVIESCAPVFDDLLASGEVGACAPVHDDLLTSLGDDLLAPVEGAPVYDDLLASFKGGACAPVQDDMLASLEGGTLTAPVYDDLLASVRGAPVYDDLLASVEGCGACAPVHDDLLASVRGAPVYDDLLASVEGGDCAPVYDDLLASVGGGCAPVHDDLLASLEDSDCAPVHDDLLASVGGAPVYDDLLASVEGGDCAPVYDDLMAFGKGAPVYDDLLASVEGSACNPLSSNRCERLVDIGTVTTSFDVIMLARTGLHRRWPRGKEDLQRASEGTASRKHWQPHGNGKDARFRVQLPEVVEELNPAKRCIGGRPSLHAQEALGAEVGLAEEIGRGVVKFCSTSCHGGRRVVDRSICEATDGFESRGIGEAMREHNSRPTPQVPQRDGCTQDGGHETQEQMMSCEKGAEVFGVELRAKEQLFCGKRAELRALYGKGFDMLKRNRHREETEKQDMDGSDTEYLIDNESSEQLYLETRLDVDPLVTNLYMASSSSASVHRVEKTGKIADGTCEFDDRDVGAVLHLQSINELDGQDSASSPCLPNKPSTGNDLTPTS